MEMERDVEGQRWMDRAIKNDDQDEKMMIKREKDGESNEE
jgi:hypothetical protein